VNSVHFFDCCINNKNVTENWKLKLTYKCSREKISCRWRLLSSDFDNIAMYTCLTTLHVIRWDLEGGTYILYGLDNISSSSPQPKWSWTMILYRVQTDREKKWFISPRYKMKFKRTRNSTCQYSSSSFLV